MKNLVEDYDIVVVGAGHAGCEAALAGARLGLETIMFTVSAESIALMPCNPNVGGSSKGHLVRELDALGGEMGRTADECCLQSRMLNLGKGPAVHSLRVQIDRSKYKNVMKRKLESQKNLDLRQAEIVKIERLEDGTWNLETRLKAIFHTKTVIIATGTYLKGKIFVGDVSYEGGPDGLFPAAFLSESLRKMGIKLRRFKTGTPARALKSSINFEGLEEQFGDEPITPFSYDTKEKLQNKITCHISWTNEKTKKIILENLHKSPLYSGLIEGVGPRYCPSLEDKIVRFPDKERHQLFIEPCGENTQEMYLQGMSSSLPEEVQLQFYKTIKGLENVLIMRSAYAIEYDCVDPLQMDNSLEFKDYSGFFGAGQFNGSSGYEEAAAQGLIAGINAARKVLGKPKFILDRASSYIGTLIDDIVTKGVKDPYRMMTSRSEYRLILRQDNADKRLTPFGRELGLISDDRWNRFLEKQNQKNGEIKRLKNTVIAPSKEVNDIIVSRETMPIKKGIKLIDLLKRPQLNYDCLKNIDLNRPNYDDAVFKEVEIEIKYEGYIKKQEAQVQEMRRLETKLLPNDIDYKEIKGLRLEAIEKLSLIKPQNIGQASRISGVSPADISVLLIWLSRKNREGNAF